MPSAFALYLRAGRGLVGAQRANLETKFNPWHDEEYGRFTFAGQGRYFGAGAAGTGNRGAAGRRGFPSGGGSFGGGGTSGSWVPPNEFDPRHARNHRVYVVQRGDSLAKVARSRRGLTVADLAWLNGLDPSRPLRIGQAIKVPHQRYLDQGKEARDKSVALANYIKLTGKLPPNAADPPSMTTMVEAAGQRELVANGYRYNSDVLLRTRRVDGELRLRREPRSRSAQANAGKPDRRPGDDGGHYIAARFNGPGAAFNHFAQDANFNRGAYRALEDEWAKAIKAGKRVFVDIIPYYRGTSMRPYKLKVISVVGGHRTAKKFPNESTGRKDAD